MVLLVGEKHPNVAVERCRPSRWRLHGLLPVFFALLLGRWPDEAKRSARGPLPCENYATVSVIHPTWRALRDVQVVSIPSCSSTTSSTKRTTPQCGPCSDAIVGRATTACVSSPWDWAVSTSKHMQQNMGILFHASVSGRALTG